MEHSNANEGFAEKNRAYFDERARSYDSAPWVQKLTAQLTEELQARLDWIGAPFLPPDDEDDNEDDDIEATGGSKGKNPRGTCRILDYACGPGMASRALAPYASALVGVHISPAMVDVYNERAANQGLSREFMHAVQGDLIAPETLSTVASSGAGENLVDFDLAIISGGFHHFEDAPRAARQLVQRLRVGGVLLILDFVAHGHWGMEDEEGGEHGHDPDHAHPHAHETTTTPAASLGDDAERRRIREAIKTIRYHGFMEEQITGMLRDAGCEDVRYVELGKGVTMGSSGKKMERRMFMVRGARKG